MKDNISDILVLGIFFMSYPIFILVFVLVLFLLPILFLYILYFKQYHQ